MDRLGLAFPKAELSDDVFDRLDQVRRITKRVLPGLVGSQQVAIKDGENMVSTKAGSEDDLVRTRSHRTDREHARTRRVMTTRFAWMCSHERYQPEELLEQARLAEEVGFDAVGSSDGFQPWVDDRSAAGFAWSWLGSTAAVTSRVTLVTIATSPLFRYHPAVKIAQAAATMDRLSGGRFVLGVGTGDPINDAPLGWKNVRYGERARGSGRRWSSSAGCGRGRR